MFLKKIKKSKKLKEILLTLSKDEIKNIADISIYSRGYNYYKNNEVFDIELKDESRLHARVKGNHSSSYIIKIYKENDVLRGKCNCPYSDICKHIVATLLSISQIKEMKESVVLTHKDRLLSHLETLSSTELINLVMEFAPESFKKEIILEDSSSEEVNHCLTELDSSLNFVLGDEDLLYDPEAFQEVISEYIEKFKPFINQNSDEVFKILFDMSETIFCQSENGYLWIDHYDSRGEEYFDFDILSREIMGLIEKIKEPSKKLDIFMKFADLSNKVGDLSVDYAYFEVEDKTSYLSYFNEESTLGFFTFIEELLSFAEREKFLIDYGTPSANKYLIDLYLQNNQRQKAIEFLEYILEQEFQLHDVKRLMELKEISSEQLRQFLLQAIEINVYGYFDFIVEHIGKTENKIELEQLIKAKDIARYYDYLEKEDREEELYSLLTKLPVNKNRFFQRYKHNYKEEAIKFFNDEIEKNVKTTGDEYYRAIADALGHLKELIEFNEFTLIVKNLKNEYKRRRNFVAILEKRFNLN